MKKRIALISVYHKNGITEFARQLQDLNFEIVASGGTAKHLSAAGLPVTDVASLVGGGPILGHRVVTLSREVHAGLLAKNVEQDREELAELHIPYIDLVCVDLYPLQEEINKPDCTPSSVIEQTDIGGPTMLRSAAKGRRIVVCDPNDRQIVIDWLRMGRPEERIFLNHLAAKAEYTVAKYCLLSANYHSQGDYDGFIGQKKLTCKYGENGYQTPAYLYETVSEKDDPLSLSAFHLIAGDSPSFNNLCDLDRLTQTMTHIAATFQLNCGTAPLIAIGVKHGNACGAGYDYRDEKIALKKMLLGDPVALFGGFVMLNFPVTDEVVEVILKIEKEKNVLLDGIAAPAFTDSAIESLARKKGKCRFLENPLLSYLGIESLDQSAIHRYVRGGFLLQPNYSFILNIRSGLLEQYGPSASNRERDDLMFAKAICDTSNSNTITLVNSGQLIGNGIGQQSRVRAANFAIAIANEYGHETHGAVAASDSFFPFTDGPERLIDAGIKAIVTCGGSVRDKEVIALCKAHNLSLWMIPNSFGRGFYNH